MDLNANGELLVSRHWPIPGNQLFDRLAYSLLDAQTGSENWGYEYELLDTMPFDGGVQTFSIAQHGNNESFFTAGRLRFSSPSIDDRHFIINITPSGQIINSIIVDEPNMLRVNSMVTHVDGSVYLLGRLKVNSWNEFGGALLMQFDENLNLLWAKKLAADQYLSLIHI